MPGEPGEPTGPPTPDQANRDVIDFEEFEFQNLQWEQLDPKRKRCSMNIKVGDKLVRFAGFSQVPKDDTENMFFDFFVGSSRVNLSFTRSLDQKRNRQDVMSDLYRREDVHRFPREFARQVYRKALLYFQFLANTTRTPLVHIVRHESNSLSNEKWLAKFEPILKEFGYELFEGGPDWIKTYEPQI